MTNEEKNSFDAFKSLREAAWESFNERRKYEWQVSLALWTALAVVLGFIAKGDGFSIYGSHCYLFVVLVTLVVLLHIYWVNRVRKRHDHDRNLEQFFQRKMNGILHVKYPQEIEEECKKHRENFFLRRWSDVFQCGITFVIGVTTIIAISVKSADRTIVNNLQPLTITNHVILER